MKITIRQYAVMFSLLVLSACSSKQNSDVPENAINTDVVNNPATASKSTNPKDNVPAYEFVTEEHDFGTITQGESVSFAFRFKNSGKGDMVIRSASGSCGCTVPEYPKDPIKPGESGIINVTFNSEGKEGLQNKTVTLIANTIPNTHVLTIKGNVIKQ
jgi:hypothetical protein